MRDFLLIVVAAAISCGCATTGGMGTGYGSQYEPVIDARKGDEYYRDLYECRQLAQQVQGRKNQEALSQAVVGAVVGAALGGALGNNRGDVGEGAAYGAALGLGGGALSAGDAGKTVIVNCMIGRGYNVLY